MLDIVAYDHKTGKKYRLKNTAAELLRLSPVCPVVKSAPNSMYRECTHLYLDIWGMYYLIQRIDTSDSSSWIIELSADIHIQ